MAQWYGHTRSYATPDARSTRVPDDWSNEGRVEQIHGRGVSMDTRKQVHIIMLLAVTIMLVLVNLDYNPFNYTILNNGLIIILSIIFIKAYDMVIKDD